MSVAFYNEWDKFCCDWTRELMADGLIAQGDIDGRDIRDIAPAGLMGYRQWHLFSGIGIWSAALRVAGWDDSREVLTVSCPCQPFSSAGKGAGFADERHLWPAAFHLIQQIRPAVIFGEQVASKDGRAWLDLVLSDLEAAAYTVWPVITCACGFGAPHIRQRLYFCGVALGDSNIARPQGRLGVSERADELAAWPGSVAGRLADPTQPGERGRGVCRPGEGDCTLLESSTQQRSQRPSSPERLALAAGERRQPIAWHDGDDGQGIHATEQREQLGDLGELGGVGDASGATGQRDTRSVLAAEAGEHGAGVAVDGRVPERPEHAGTGVATRPGPTNGLWANPDWLLCRDAKWRPVEPETFPLAPTGTFSNRVAELRGAGNALCLAQAQGFISAVMEVLA